MKDIKFRFERKFVLSKNYNIEKVESAFLRSNFNFIKQYEDRFVNSIYFEKESLTSLRENLDGNNFKKKLRLRWYGKIDKIKNPNFEIKFKKGHLNTKKIYAFNNFFKNFSKKNLNLIYLILSKKLSFLKKYRIISSTHYRRKYFVSQNKKIRATIDYEIFYKNLREIDNFDLCKVDSRPIIEIKYDSSNDNYVRNNLKNLTLRFTKNSKYINSVISN